MGSLVAWLKQNGRPKPLLDRLAVLKCTGRTINHANCVNLVLIAATPLRTASFSSRGALMRSMCVSAKEDQRSDRNCPRSVPAISGLLGDWNRTLPPPRGRPVSRKNLLEEILQGDPRAPIGLLVIGGRRRPVFRHEPVGACVYSARGSFICVVWGPSVLGVLKKPRQRTGGTLVKSLPHWGQPLGATPP